MYRYLGPNGDILRHLANKMQKEHQAQASCRPWCPRAQRHGLKKPVCWLLITHPCSR